MKYAHGFHEEESYDFKGTDVFEHQIVLENTRPKRTPEYRVSYALRDEMKSEVNKMLNIGVIRDSKSPRSSSAILHRKMSENGKQKCSFFVQFRAINSVTNFDTYPFPVFQGTTFNPHGSKYYIVLDCQYGFWQVSILEEHKKHRLSVPSGHFEFNKLPFGLSNSPSSFQRLMEVVTKDLVGTECCVFVDDIIIVSRSVQKHGQRLEQVLQRIDKSKLKLHTGKSMLPQLQVNYVGFVLSEKGVSSSPDKIKAVRNYNTPKNVKDVRSYTGLTSFYRRLILDIATYRAHQERQIFIWTQSQQMPLCV